MSDDNLPSQIGTYTILKSLGKGGMGEVFLAFDPKCKRQVALKRIKSELAQREVIKNRFLKEAIITSQLTHPSIVPIYTLHDEPSDLYYTMPYLEGTTLKEKIKVADKNPGEYSVPYFLRIFISLCQAVAYAHSKGFLHRDLKPENIIVGRFGEVYILDWGLVKAIDDKTLDDDSDIEPLAAHLTRPGKLVGTLAYMAPERVKGELSSITTDIYSLGVIFYQLLTLHLPFRRKSIKEFKANISKEKLIDPLEVAPYRDIPLELTLSVKKCLDKDKKNRYQDIPSLISDLENYLEGRSDWFLATKLQLNNKNDWEFQEHFVIPKGAQKSEWVTASVSKESFSGNVQILAKVKIHEKGSGIGFLLSVPEISERNHPLDGYSLWLSAKKEEATKLFKSSVEVLRLEDCFLEKTVWHEIKIEKIESHIHCYIDQKLIFSYISYLPLFGSHIGIVNKDSYFELSDIHLSIGSFNLKLSCLAIPNTFLAIKDFSRALAEYRRITKAFWGRQEAREAQFLIGITLLEQAKVTKTPDPQLLDQAMLEFETLRTTPGAPLEYLGKALIYEYTGEIEEEVKALSLGLRRYANHPLFHLLKDQILFRLHSRTKQTRLVTFHLMLLVLSSLSDKKPLQTDLLIDAIQKPLDPPFIITRKNDEHYAFFQLELAFFLMKPLFIKEIIEKSELRELHLQGFIALLHLGQKDLIQSLMPQIAPKEYGLIEWILCQEEEIGEDLYSYLPLIIDETTFNITLVLLIEALDHENKPFLIEAYTKLFDRLESDRSKKEFDRIMISLYLQDHEWQSIESIFQRYTLEELTEENSDLYFLYGTYLYAREGKEIALMHFNALLDSAYPKLSALASHYLFSRGFDPALWLKNALPYEKQVLYRQLIIFYKATSNHTLYMHFKKEIEQLKLSLFN